MHQKGDKMHSKLNSQGLQLLFKKSFMNFISILFKIISKTSAGPNQRIEESGREEISIEVKLERL